MNNTKAYLTRVKTKSQVTIPAQLRKRLNLSEGDLLEVSVEGDRLILEPRAVTSKNDIDKAFVDALKDLKSGNVFGPFADVDSFKAAVRKRAK